MFQACVPDDADQVKVVLTLALVVSTGGMATLGPQPRGRDVNAARSILVRCGLVVP